MGYGSRTDSSGKTQQAEGSAPVQTGERVKNCKVIDFDFAKNKDGEVQDNSAILSIEQENGAVFKHRFFESDNAKAKDIVNRQMLHVFTRFVSEQEYYAAVENSTNFQEFITGLKTLLPKAKGKLINCKIILSKNTQNENWYPAFPAIPDFVELADTKEEDSRFRTNPKYDRYQKPDFDNAEDLESDAPAQKQEEEEVDF